MAILLSPWTMRVKQLVDIIIQDKAYESDVSASRVQTSLNYFSVTLAKHLHVLNRDVPRESPWLASVMLYVSLGDCDPESAYSEDEQFQAGKYIGIAQRSGWTPQDMLQAIEWGKTSMPHYPTAQQWAGVFGLTLKEIERIQTSLVSTIENTRSLSEQQVWDVALAVEAPFCSLMEQLLKSTPDTVFKLPDLSPET